MAGPGPRLSGGVLPIFRLAPIRLDDGIAWRPRTRKGSHDEASEFCPARDAGLPSVAGIRRPGRGARGGQVGADAEHEVSVRGAVDRAAVGFLRFARDGGRGEQPGGATVSPGRARDCPLDVRRRQRAPPGRGLRRTLDGTTYLIDSTSLRLNQHSADWARYSATVCGAKVHVIYDPNAAHPVYSAFSTATVNDISAAQVMPIVPGATYVFDLGYYDYGWWAELQAADCRIVTRLKKNTPLTVTRERLIPPGGIATSSATILSDRIGHLPARQAGRRSNPMSDEMREVRVRLDTGKVLRILTNDLVAPAHEIAEIYKQRWQIELFFRWIKQRLEIKRFIGTSENAVRIQVAVALIAFLLLRLAHAGQKAVPDLLAFVRGVRVHLLHRRDINALDSPERPPEIDPRQLSLEGCFA